MRKLILLFILAGTFIMQSCYVTHPRYATIDQVKQVEIGMVKDSVDSLLEMDASDIVAKTDSGITYIYKYRLKEVRRVPKTTHHNKGLEVEGGFKNLILTFNNNNEVVTIKTEEEKRPSEVKQKNIDVAKIIDTFSTFITVTLPAVLVYLSLN